MPKISFILSEEVTAVKDDASPQDKKSSDVDMEDASSPSVNGVTKKKIEPAPISKISSTILGRSSRELMSAKQTTNRNVTIPRDHMFQVSNIQNQTLAVYSETNDTKKLTLEGVVVQKGECRPQATKDYMSLKQENFRRVQQPQRSVMKLDKAVVSYKPVSMHVNEVSIFKKTKRYVPQSLAMCENLYQFSHEPLFLKYFLEHFLPLLIRSRTWQRKRNKGRNRGKTRTRCKICCSEHLRSISIIR